ncbi:MAG TPA: T9SS type A sorting domain-containing protein [Bacteroidales bacterium]|nr:T9SS type A sorting domain-containing protein [Bacteroidales bacterium]HRZ49995.1 T9SS type A sorting domain-containing protein [Bacteroidales bacterium]
MKRRILTGFIILATATLALTAQTDTTRKGSVYFKSIRIIGNDTLVEEKNMDLDYGTSGFSFRFGDEEDSLSSDDMIREFRFDTPDSLDLNRLFRNPQWSEPFNSDSLLNHFRFSFPEIEVPGDEPYHFEFRLPDEGSFGYPDNPGQQLIRPGSFPVFSVEDVAIYPESNSVKNFVIRPVPGAGIFLVEADLNNKKSEYTVYDNKGKVLYSEKFRNEGGSFRRVLTLKELGTGTYFVEVKNGRSIKKKRLTLR